MTPSRREFLAGAGALATAAATGLTEGLLADAAGAASTVAPLRPLPRPARSGLNHIVVVMMENRSFDHYLGWLPGAARKQAGLTYLDGNGDAHDTHHLSDDNQGCAHHDPDHSYEGGRVQLNHGACDGFLRSGDNDEFAIGYYKAEDLDFYRRAAPYWTVCDHYFSATMAETYPNRFYQHAAQTDRIHNSFTVAEMPTIWDRLAAAGVSARYYYSDLPFIALFGTRHLNIARPFNQFLTDARLGRLPAVSFVDPRFTDEGEGTSNDDHPHADIRAGQRFLNTVYRAMVQSPNWDHSLLVINYDEWGGFFDHVRPKTTYDARPDLGTQLRGFRVPCLLVSPFARRRSIARQTYDHTSILKMISWRHGLPALTRRDRYARNIAEVLDFSRRYTTAPTWSVPAITPQACSTQVAPDYEDWYGLAEVAEANGFEISPT
jgi:phospholipase C